MKHLAMALLTSFLLSHSPASAAVKSIKAFKSLANIVQSYEMEHYYIQVHDDLGEIKELLKGESCRFKKISALKLANGTREIIDEGISRALDSGIIDQDDGYYSLMESLQEATLALKKELQGKTLAVCNITSVPAYSDGHTLTVVKVNGKIAFAYEVGYPD